MTLCVESRGGVVRFRVKVQARARREGIAGVYGGALRVRVTSPPVEGRANQALVVPLGAGLGGRLHVPQTSIKIAAGEGAPLKLIEVAGLDAATVLERLWPEPADPGSKAGRPE